MLDANAKISCTIPLFKLPRNNRRFVKQCQIAFCIGILYKYKFTFFILIFSPWSHHKP